MRRLASGSFWAWCCCILAREYHAFCDANGGLQGNWIGLGPASLVQRTFDPILWAQGSAALPYLEDGPMTDAQTWNRIMGMFEGNFLGYAVWFN